MCSNSSGVDNTVYMIFDTSGSGLLCDKINEPVVLKTPSEEIKPWTYFSKGEFGIVLGEKEGAVTESTTYGSYRFEVVKSKSGERSAAVFARKGAGEKAFGSVEGEIWRVDGSKQERIGEEAFMEVVTPDGKKHTGRMIRLRGEGQKWTRDMGGRIMQREADGKVAQAGWVSWRKVTTPEGNHLAILMTKSMDKEAKWAGRYDGKLYEDR